jgi:nicotinamidase-related amidase
MHGIGEKGRQQRRTLSIQVIILRGPVSVGPRDPREPMPLSLIVIDPLFDFLHEEGVFSRAFGIDDVYPCRIILPNLNSLLSTIKDRLDISKILVKSAYVPNQFGKNLEFLCTTSFGQRSLLSEDLFSISVVKHSNSIFDVHDPDSISFLETKLEKEVFVCGLTTTSCVRVSVDALIKRGHTVYLAEDTMAARQSNSKTVSDLIEQWRTWRQVRIMKSWTEIVHLASC